MLALLELQTRDANDRRLRWAGALRLDRDWPRTHPENYAIFGRSSVKGSAILPSSPFRCHDQASAYRLGGGTGAGGRAELGEQA